MTPTPMSVLSAAESASDAALAALRSARRSPWLDVARIAEDLHAAAVPLPYRATIEAAASRLRMIARANGPDLPALESTASAAAAAVDVAYAAALVAADAGDPNSTIA